MHLRTLATVATRCINVVNFIREIEPRFEMDMMLPVQEQMNILLQHQLPATWLLQFDALVSGPFVPFLKENMAENHEVGFWFEMNERHCRAAEVEWRGRPGYPWDHTPSVAFTIGYTPEERVKLADTAMETFRSIWGKYPSSVASWNLDALTIAHLVDNYGVNAFAVCRDQIATDGFTIWGAPIAGYYPSSTDCWSPAVDPQHQIDAPIFRMLGQDPVYYYDLEAKLPDGTTIREPITMEPAWTAGRTDIFIREFLEMIEEEPTGQFAFAQLGQENTFPWDQQKEGYPKQMEALARLRESGKVHVETMGESGRRFQQTFNTTPVQAQVMLQDPFGNTEEPETSAWYQSRFYRANLHFKDDLPYLRDLTIYRDATEQPFLREATRLQDVEQRVPAVLDGFHWRREGEDVGAGGFFTVDGERIKLSGKPVVREEGNEMLVEVSVSEERTLHVRFLERSLRIWMTPAPEEGLALEFVWDPTKAAFVGIDGQSVKYRANDFDYEVKVKGERLRETSTGWTVEERNNGIELDLTGR